MDLRHRRPIEQNNTLDFGIARRFDVGRSLSQQAVPIVSGLGADLLRPRSHLSVDLVNYRSQKSAFVPEVVVKRPSRQTDFGGQLIHGGGRIALFGTPFRAAAISFARFSSIVSTRRFAIIVAVPALTYATYMD